MPFSQVFSPTTSSSAKTPSMRAVLRCFFCFHPHRHHYIVFCFIVDLKVWVCFDDDKVTPVREIYWGLLVCFCTIQLSFFIDELRGACCACNHLVARWAVPMMTQRMLRALVASCLTPSSTKWTGFSSSASSVAAAASFLGFLR